MFSLWRQRKSSERSVDPPNWKWRLFGLFRRFVGRVIALYLLLLIVGLIPVNNDFRSASDGIEIFISSNGVHADVVVPFERILLIGMTFVRITISKEIQPLPLMLLLVGVIKDFMWRHRPGPI